MVEAADLPSKIGGRRPALFFTDRVVEEKAGILSPGEELLFGHTGGYFWTPTLHNALCTNAASDFQTAPLLLNAIIDGTIKNRGDAASWNKDVSDDWEETFPIYNKAFFARLKDGRIIFGRRRLEDGQVEILREQLPWVAQDVNPETPGDIAIYTPMNEKVKERTDEDYPEQDRKEAYKEIPQYKVGEDRFNIVVVNNIAHIYYDEVYLQPKGVVISLSEEKFEEIFGRELAGEVIALSKETVEGREEKKGKVADIKIKLAPPKEFEKEWDNIDYLYGGLTLVWDANAKKDLLPEEIKSLVLEGNSPSDVSGPMGNIIDTVRENFKKEGWYRDYSRVTQETQLQQLIVRGPRCFLVKTENYCMGVIIDGRQDPSRGANFADMVYHAHENLFQLLKDRHNGNEAKARDEFEKEISSLQILNFDGGSSVGFGTFKKPDRDGNVIEEYLPVPPRAPGPSNGVGSERPVPLLMVYSGEGKGIEEVSIDTAGIKMAFIGPRDLSQFTETPVLFLDTDVAANPSGFEEALGQLRRNEGNIPMICLTEHTENSIGLILGEIDLRGVEFRTLGQLGFQNTEELNEFMCLIAGIDNLQCVPLTESLSEAYEILKKAKDQV